MTKHRMTILGTVHPDAMALVEARDDVAVTVVAEALAPRDVIREAIADAHGIEVRTAILDAEMLGAVEDLKIVSRHGVGTDSVAVDHMTARGLPVAIAVGGNDRSVAEHTMTMALHFARDMPLQHELGLAGDWSRRAELKAYDLEDRTMLIIGHGRIGSRVGALARAFGMRVVAFDPYIAGVPDGIEHASDMRAALAEADIVTVHVPKYDETTPLIDRTAIGAMRPDSILINNARGGICDEPAVAAALHDGHLRGYGCDVFSVEPTPPDNPILSAPNTLLSTHSASMTPQGMRRMGMIAVQNVLDCFDGRLKPEMVFNRKELGW